VNDAATSDQNSRPARVKPKQAVRQSLGRLGERMAGEALWAQGYYILERNFRCRYGEIDLVAEHEGELVFIEVKTRRGTSFGRPEEAVTFRKQQKILEVAAFYLDMHHCSQRAWRIDVVAVQFSQAGKFEEIRIYHHAVTG
jgi:putative endonuclease